jgi:SAM-dependent methyltransferase
LKEEELNISSEERYIREERFWHDETDENARTHTSEYYKVLKSRDEFYETLVVSHCSGRRVLEYGCGGGHWARLIAKRGASKVVAIDLSATRIKQARETARLEHIDNVDFQVKNAEALDFDNDTFDVVCGTAILHHLDLHRAFSEIVRILRFEGIAMFMEPLAHNPLINLYRRLTPRLRTEDEHPLRLEDIHLAQSCFENVDMHFFGFLSLLAMPFSNTRHFDSLRIVLDGVDRFLFRRAPFLRRYAWFCVMVLSHPKRPAARAEN